MSDPRIITDNLGHHFQMLKRGEKYTATYQPNVKMPKSAFSMVRSAGNTEGLSSETQKAIMKSGASVQHTPPEIRNPLLNIINFYLPTNYKVLNQWLRYFDRFHPIVGSCIDMHAEYPISQFELDGIDDPHILHTYEDAAIDMDLFQTVLDMSREYELIGEVFPFAHWNDEKNYFDKVVVLNPDFVVVNSAQLAVGSKPQFELEPDEDLKRLVHSTDERDLEIKQYLDPITLRCVEEGRNIPMDAFNLSHIARRASPYDPRGTSIVIRALKDLLYEDKLREAQYAISDGLITPKQIWKLGDPQNGYMPSDDDIADFIRLLQSSAHDPLFAIVTHYGVQLDMVGASGRLLPIIPEFDFTTERILSALYTSKAAIHGEGPGWSSGPIIAFEILQGRYMAKREKIENWLMQKVWIPIALANGFYKPVTKMSGGSDSRIRVAGQERELILPKIRWKQKLQLVEDSSKKQYAEQARARMDICYDTWCKVMGYDDKYEIAQIDKERGGWADPNYRKRLVQKDDLEFQSNLKQEGLLPETQPIVMPGQGQMMLPGFGQTSAPKAPAGTGQSGQGTKPSTSKQSKKYQFGGQEDRIRAVIRKENQLIDKFNQTSGDRETALQYLDRFEKQIDTTLAEMK